MTSDWPVSCVNIAVISQITWCWETFLTKLAPMRLGLPVNHFVIVQVAGCCESKMKTQEILHVHFSVAKVTLESQMSYIYLPAYDI